MNSFVTLIYSLYYRGWESLYIWVIVYIFHAGLGMKLLQGKCVTKWAFYFFSSIFSHPFFLSLNVVSALFSGGDGFVVSCLSWLFVGWGTINPNVAFFATMVTSQFSDLHFRIQYYVFWFVLFYPRHPLWLKLKTKILSPASLYGPCTSRGYHHLLLSA